MLGDGPRFLDSMTTMLIMMVCRRALGGIMMTTQMRVRVGYIREGVQRAQKVLCAKSWVLHKGGHAEGNAHYMNRLSMRGEGRHERRGDMHSKQTHK